MQNWGVEFKRALIFFLFVMLFVWTAKLGFLQNLPVIGNLFKWIGHLFGGGQDQL